MMSLGDTAGAVVAAAATAGTLAAARDAAREMADAPKQDAAMAATMAELILRAALSLILRWPFSSCPHWNFHEWAPT